ncbi:MAG: T9SS type A sorting domain-containing protein [Bacteroidota bacterium]
MKFFFQIIAILHCATIATAQCEDFNLGFGVNGVAQVSMASGSITEIMNNSFLDADDGIVCVGYSFTNVHDAMAISFQKADGTINGEVGGDGKIIYAVGEDNYGSVGMLTSEGKYLIAGNWSFFFNEQYKFRQLLPDGSPDDSFGVNGEVYPFLQESVIQQTRGISQDATGNIIGTGIARVFNTDWLVYMKLSKSGEELIEPKRITLPGVSSFVSGKQLRYKNEVLVTGEALVGAQTKGAIVKLTGEGELDPVFGLSGTVHAPISDGRPSKVVNVFSPDDETIIAVGYHLGVDKNTLFMLSLDSKGDRTSDFFDEGYSLIDIDKNSHPVDFMMNGDDIYIAVNNQSTSKGEIYKANTQGELINDFGENGIFPLGTGDSEKLARIHLNSENDIIVTGISDQDFTVWSLHTCMDVSVESENINEEINLYPNPAAAQINLDFGKATQVDEIMILDIYGNTINTLGLDGIIRESIMIDVNNLPMGMYFMQVKNQNQILVSTFIKI